MQKAASAKRTNRLVLLCLLASVLAVALDFGFGFAKAEAVAGPLTREGYRISHSPIGSPNEISYTAVISFYLPFVSAYRTCPSQTGQSYSSLPVGAFPPPGDPPPEQHPDLNLAVRSYLPSTTAQLRLVDWTGETDALAPQFRSLFTDNRIPTLKTAYQVYDWDWNGRKRGLPLTSWDVTLLGMGTNTGETIQTPQSGYTVGNLPLGFAATVLYAASDRITLSYTTDGSVANGYAIHIENICVDSSLFSLYQSLNAGGRTRMPAVTGRQALGRATGIEIQVAIRDTGNFMDPRSRKDWWQH